MLRRIAGVLCMDVVSQIENSDSIAIAHPIFNFTIGLHSLSTIFSLFFREKFQKQ